MMVSGPSASGVIGKNVSMTQPQSCCRGSWKTLLNEVFGVDGVEEFLEVVDDLVLGEWLFVQIGE